MAVSHKDIGDFIDAAVQDAVAADRLLQACPDLRSATWLGESLLCFLAIENFPAGVRYLASRGWSVDERAVDGTTPLIDAVGAGAHDAVVVLLELGADPSSSSETYDNALHRAIRSGDARMVRILLEHGADPSYTTDSGETALDILPNKVEKQSAIKALLASHGLQIPEAEQGEPPEPR